MDSTRQKRKEEISKALTFIQSSLAYPEPEGYQDFLTKLVCNLLDEGNSSFKDEHWEEAVGEFTEGLNVADYAAAEKIHIPEALLESLYVNRAAAYHSMGKYDQGVQDCNKALGVCKESRRALYRKALCLKELGQYKEAYNCTTDCLLATHSDKRVSDLAQELSAHLGLKNRKPYITTKKAVIVTNGNVPAETVKVSSMSTGNGVNPLHGIAPASFTSVPETSITSLSHMDVPSVLDTLDTLDTLEDSELMGEDLDSLLDCFPNEHEETETLLKTALSDNSTKSTGKCPVSSVLPAPTPQLPPAFFNSAVSQLNSLDTFSGGESSTPESTLKALDALDSFSDFRGGVAAAPLELASAALDSLDGLDSLDDFLDTTPSADTTLEMNDSQTKVKPEEKSLDDLLDELDVLEPSGLSAPKPNQSPVDRLDTLDALDVFPSCVSKTFLPAGKRSLDSLSKFNSDGLSKRHSATATTAKSPHSDYKEMPKQAVGALCNPLASTHDFMQACSLCFPRQGASIYSFDHKPELVHSCKRDILLCRKKVGYPSEWTRVRIRPKWTSFSGPFVLCRELLKSGEVGVCKFGEKCTFAFNQLEIDVWTEERKGTLDRNLLFVPAAIKLDPVNNIIRLLQEHKGTFIFLCQICYDNKPRIISNRCRDTPTTCSNFDARHAFTANKCLVFVVRTTSVNYNKIRPFPIPCRMDLCHHAIRYGCQREDNCQFAHSVIELKTWRVQQDTGISHEEIVEISQKYYEKQEYKSPKHKVNKVLSPPGGCGSRPRTGRGGPGKSLGMNMKFVCAQCWRDGQISEPDKCLKYCTSKARHTWIKERRVLLVKSVERNKWVQVRALPHAKSAPAHYDLCAHILEKRKCTYPGNCTFAHSQEEKDMWMYMKNNDLRDMQQMYDMWLALTNPNRQAGETALPQPVQEEKFIVMPADDAEPMSGLHCRLCGKHSNSERQWQQHISSEKHKDRVFSCEGEEEDLMWCYRFPGACFELCSKLGDSCPDGVSCDYAHCLEELQEWIERRDLLRRKLTRAREDMLIMPDEHDFGKYNFLLQD
ncbi:zinc finger CCCH domain-containing protein 7B-like [Thalassophryne amazonica]|uniref:zinc finger CCCH domain-containing protein 7B-like n=1 Tax=Thalassophryne amazonica TaxID=390379 RepID=UPI00147137A4|nr:zinc finger CCCH domain-containing protein 7B-like [Thalassophryne amazonica]